MVRTRIAPPLKWHGGKHYLASRIVGLMPPHTHYVEPFAGGLSVLLAKDPDGISEVANDIDGNLTNFWRTLQAPDLFSQFRQAVEAIPFSEREWKDAAEQLDDTNSVRRAVAFFIRCRQSLAGRMDSFAPLSRTRTRRGMNEQASAWLASVDGLHIVHQRLRRVVVLNRDAVDVIRQQDGPNTLFYLDPPYLCSTRTAPKVYQHEFTTEDHERLLAVVRSCAGRVMLSGYRNDLYDSSLTGWSRHDFQLANHAAGGDIKRRMTECVWCNFPTTTPGKQSSQPADLLSTPCET